MRNYFIRLIILSIALWFSACGSTGTPTSSTGSSGIEVNTKRTLIDNTKTKFYLEFSMKSNYQDGVTAELSDISLDLNSCIINKGSLNIAENTLSFSKHSEAHTVTLTAEFIKPCLPTGYTIKANNYLTYENTANKSTYSSGFKPITIDGNLTIEDTTTIFDYGIELRSVDNQPKIKLDSKKRYKLFLVNLDNNESIPNDRVNYTTIRSSDPSKVRLIDPNNYLIDNGETQSELSFYKTNGIDLYIQTYTASGVVNFDVSANYTNNRGEDYDINTTTSLVILSGEPTAFSINSTGVEYNFDTKWFEQKFLISASDRYNNVVNIPSKINVSAMADFSKDKSGKRILYGKFSNTKGEIIADKETHTALFKSNSQIFGNIDTQRDFLLLFGDVTSYDALGKWDIDPYNNTETTVALADSYYGDNHNNLGFALGHNYYTQICSSESKEWELKIDSTDGTYQLDEEGKTYMTLKFPAYMIGKKIALGVNFSGVKKRSGEVHFETLHSFQGVKAPETINIDANTSTAISKSFAFEIDTGTEDRFWVKNAKVVCKTKAENVVVTAFSQNSEVKNINDCGNSENGEIAYWNITVQLEDLSKAGSFSFEECQVSSFIDEF